ncbi:MAG: HYR domain-containing protein, partial [Bacteroidota bacterium]
GGSNQVLVELAIIDDNLSEGNEEVEISLNNPVNASICTGEGLATGTIIDDETTSCISSVTPSINENSGSVFFDFNISNPQIDDITLNLALDFTGHSASSDDLNLVQNTLSILAGATSASLEIEIQDDLIDEINETFELQILSVSGSSMCSTLEIIGVIEDNDVPSPTCQDLNVGLDENGLYTLEEDAIFSGDNSLGTIVSFDTDLNNFDCSDAGESILVTLQITDENGFINSCSSTVHVADNSLPVIDCQDLSVDFDGIIPAIITESDFIQNAADNCGIDSTYLSQYEFNSTGLFDVSAFAVDLFSNTEEAICQVSVNYTGVGPNISCQTDTIYLDELGFATAIPMEFDNGSTGLGTLDFTLSQTNFDCSGSGIASPQSLTLFVEDDSGIQNTCITQVHILDTISPNFEVTEPTFTLDSEGELFLSPNEFILSGSESDNCSIQSMSISASSFNSPGTFPISVHVFDSSSNETIKATTLEVLSNPGPTAICQNDTLYLNNEGNAVASASNIDNLSWDDGSIQDMWLDQENFDCSHLGQNTVSLFVEDNLNQQNSCQAQILVIDSIAPIANSAILPIIEGDCSVTITNMDFPTATDNCGASITATTVDPLEYIVKGTHEIEWVYVDASGNTSSQTQIIEIADEENPVINCPSDTTLLNTYGESGANVVFDLPDYSDNCSASLVQISGPSNGEFFDLGEHTLEFNAADPSGNNANCSFKVTVIDTIAPTFESADMDICAGNVLIEAPIANDNSGGLVTITNDHNGQSSIDEILNAGVYSITWTAIDESGNTASITSNLTVVDQEIAPEAGDDQEIFFSQQGQLDGNEYVNEIGTWKVESGSAVISDIHDPQASISNLAEGNNILSWNVDNGICPAQSDLINIYVHLFDVPNAISPDGDGMNDELYIPGLDVFNHNLIVFNRWGVKVFESQNGDKQWDGRNLNGELLPSDTYFITFQFENGLQHNSFVVLKY